METHESTNRYLNLVYDNWKNSEYLTNGADTIGNKEFNDIKGFFDFYERYYHEHLGFDRYSLPLKINKISDVYSNPEITFYYPIKTFYSLKEIFTDWGFKFSDTLLKCFKECNNIVFLFVREHESEFEYDYQELKKYITDNFLNESQFLILSNNSSHEEIKNKLNLKIQSKKLNLIKLTASSIFSVMPSTFTTDKKGKFFLCFNKSPKPHRYATLLLLDYYNILTDTNWSLIGKENRCDSQSFKDIINESILDKLDYEKFKLFDKKESDFEIGKGYFNKDLSVNYEEFNRLPDGGGMASGGLTLPEFEYTYNHSYFNIVTESLFKDNSNAVHITEKSIRPFHFYMFPIFVATHNHVKYLRDEYGFDLYDDIIDHSYDKEPNQIKRLTLLVNEIKRLYSKKDELIHFYESNQERFEKNKQIVKEISNEVEDFNFLRNLIS